MNRRGFLKASLMSLGGLIATTTSAKAKYNGIRAIFYWNLQSPPEGLDGAVRIIEELDVDFIWYAHWMVGFPMPEDLETAREIATELNKDADKFVSWCKKEYYTLEFVREQTRAVSGRTYCPAILGYTNFRWDFNFDPISFEPISEEEIWKDYLLNFGKWGIKNPRTGKPYTTRETQEIFWEMGLPKHNGIPDYSNPKVIEYYVKRAKAFKNAGASAVWYDLFFQLPLRLKQKLGLGFDHPMIRDLYDGCCRIIDGAKSLGLTVGTWYLCLNFPYENVPKVDFVNASPTVEEILRLSPDYGRWKRIEDLMSKAPNAWLLIMFDFANRDNLPLPVFSQRLSPVEQCRFLEELHTLLNRLSVEATIAYPVHGPGLGAHPRKLAWGKYKIYDATAPEFKTFETIKTLLGVIKKKHRTPFPSAIIPLILAALLLKIVNKRD